MRVAVIDYGIGNVQSVVNACVRTGAETVRITEGGALESFAPERIVLPGVGAIGAALERLRDAGFEPVLRKLVRERGTPFLGVCVGMQMLAEECEEFGSHRGLGWIPGKVTWLGAKVKAEGERLRVPHVGWNTVALSDPTDAVLGPLDGEDVYFVHSYALECPDAYAAGRTTYGRSFVSVVRRDAIYGVQFHPEKSSGVGAKLISRFIGGA